jgi:hypothetical protein
MNLEEAKKYLEKEGYLTEKIGQVYINEKEAEIIDELDKIIESFNRNGFDKIDSYIKRLENLKINIEHLAKKFVIHSLH